MFEACDAAGEGVIRLQDLANLSRSHVAGAGQVGGAGVWGAGSGWRSREWVEEVWSEVGPNHWARRQ